MRTTFRTRTGALMAACATLVVAVAVGPGSASATHYPADRDHFIATWEQVGLRLQVCADSLTVRSSPGGSVIGSLSYPQTFTVENFGGSPVGSWVYGLAWGNINKRGWVLNGWFCNPY